MLALLWTPKIKGGIQNCTVEEIFNYCRLGWVKVLSSEASTQYLITSTMTEYSWTSKSLYKLLNLYFPLYSKFPFGFCVLYNYCLNNLVTRLPQNLISLFIKR